MNRGLDLALALVLLLPAAFLCLILIVLIRIDSPGPVLFAQTRLGRGERPFTLYKLRTMRAGTGDMASHLAPGDAVTGAGRWLRRLKLDELPQIFNVLRGDMGFVGPRPGLVSQTDLARERRERGVFALRPGITGLAQTRGIDMADAARLARVDAEYLARRSLWLDLTLIWQTFSGAGRGDTVQR